MRCLVQQNVVSELANCNAQVIETLVRLPAFGADAPALAESPLNNSELFLRDNFTCLYCGQRHTPSRLTRDYIEPLSNGGENRWANVVTACQTCNRKKANMSLRESGMSLLAVPYAPIRAERKVLAGRNIVADQMNFLGRNRRVVEVKQQPRGVSYA